MMDKIYVEQIASFLKNQYADDWSPGLDEVANLSRLLARFAVDAVLGADSDATIEITDGSDDRGIDCIAVDKTSLVVIIQSKWRKDGTGSLDLSGMLKLLDGVRGLVGMTSSLPAQCSEQMREVVNEALTTPGGRLRIVTVTTARETISAEVQDPLNELLGSMNISEKNPIGSYQHLPLADVYDYALKPEKQAANIDLTLLGWGKTSDEPVSYYGRVPGLELAQHYQSFGPSLFAENIRVVLPKSEINESILATIRESPHLFWHYNNGITIIAESIEPSLSGAISKEASSFRLNGASVVNGAQTVSTLGRAFSEGEQEALEQVFVTVLVIQVPSDTPDLARRITRNANTQNVVAVQDFAFLDSDQHRLVRELDACGYEYLLRSGEKSKSGKHVIDVRQAAVAAACATSVQLAVQAKREISRLFDQSGPFYKQIFNPSVNGLFISRSHQVMQCIDSYLDNYFKASAGVNSGIATHGRLLIAHKILNDAGKSKLSTPGFDFEAFMETVEPSTEWMLLALAATFPENAYPGNVFKNQTRCEQLLADAQGILPSTGSSAAQQ